MNRNERTPDEAEVIRRAFESMAARIWTALPGVIHTVDMGRMVVSVQPTINGRFPRPDGTFQTVQMPILPDCPIMWPGGGGATMTFPIKPGDECLVVFSSRCIDNWWDQGGVQDAREPRRHNLSDGFALVGVRSKPRAALMAPAPSASAVELRTDDHSAYVAFDPTAKTLTVVAPGGVTVNTDGEATVTADGGINLNGVTIDSSGNLTSPAKIVGNQVETAAGKKLGTHKHPETGSTTLGPDNT